MRILSIGNSFSQDAQHYLHQILTAGGIQNECHNLYIGGCSYEQHWNNVLENNAGYMYQINGSHTERMVDIDTVLREREWDYVISQQASHYSGLPETYTPFADNLYAHVNELAPSAERLIMQTWAYEHDSTHDHFPTYERSQTVMYEKLCAAYEILSRRLGLRLIRCGDVVQLVRSDEHFDYPAGGQSLCRDGFHMHLVYGRFLTALTIYQTITGRRAVENTYVPPEQEGVKPDSEMLEVIRCAVDSIAMRR